MFGNRDIGMHTGRPWIHSSPGPGPELCIITDRMGPDGLADCGQPADAAVHQRSYTQGGHEFLSELMAEYQKEAERDAEAAYDAAMRVEQ
jgi:hypothetical protein